MKISNLLFIIFLSTKILYSQQVISSADISPEYLSKDQLSVAATILKAIELDRFELINTYKTEHLIKDDNRLITNLIKKYNINKKGFPPLIKDSKGNFEGQYSRAYYKSDRNKREILFIVKVGFKEKSYKVNSIELINVDNNSEADPFLSHLNKIVCGNRPVGPPAIGDLIDFKSGKEKRLRKALSFRKDDLSIVSEVYKYKEYDLSLSFTGFPGEFFDTTKIWDFNIVSLKIRELKGELKSLTSEIGNLQHLKYLDLSLQNTKVPTEIFDLKNLKELKIYSDYKIDLATSLQHVYKLKKLKILSINNDINTLPQEISLLKNLEKLSLSTNSLTSIPKEIGDLDNLSALTISGSYVEIPQEIGKLENLNSLKLSSRNLKSLPKSIGNLYNLSSLWISKAVNLDSLPKEIGHIKNIKILNFNEVEKLPKLEEPVSNVSEIYIYYAKDLSGINDYLGGTWKLRLRYCSIDTLPNIFDYGNNLAEIAIDDCSNLNYIEKSTNIPQKLRSVKIGNTGLEEIPLEILLSTKLEHLSFEGSKLKEIPLEISNSPNLKELRLSRNLIEEIPLALFKLNTCEKIYLNENKISKIDEEIRTIKPDKSLKVYLLGNPIDESLKMKNSLIKFFY